VSAGDTSWILTSSAMVMLMVPGVGLFYSGMVRRKNALSAIALTMVALVVVSIQWVAVGYSLAFGASVGGVIGSLNLLGLQNLGAMIGNVPSSAFIAFQFMFAAVTLAILTSATAERIRLSSFIVFISLWTTVVYCTMAHWVWGGGWLSQLGALDFAGGTVVHISSGFAALALAMVVGKRAGYGEHPMEPHSIPLTLLGAALLWFGWLGFNGGSALGADGLAANAFLVTNVSAAAGAVTWMLLSWRRGPPSSLGLVSGAIAGLVGITPAAGYVTPLSAIAIGAVSGGVCFMALSFRMRRGLDESLDAWAIHGIGGIWGGLATGIFASLAVNNYAGLLYGNIHQFLLQVVAILVAVAFTFTATYAIAKAVDLTMGLRVSAEEEYVGLDISQLGERAYS
jgi:Amt family ammonium transporter